MALNNGGTFYITGVSSDDLYFSDIYIEGDETIALNNGGFMAIYNHENIVIVEDLDITRAYAQEHGGVFSQYLSGGLVLGYSYIEECSSKNGGVFHLLDYAPLSVVENQMYYNYATENGGQGYFENDENENSGGFYTVTY